MAEYPQREYIVRETEYPLGYTKEEEVCELVRCRDCKKAEHDKIFREYWCEGREVEPDGYCSDGERKDCSLTSSITPGHGRTPKA